MIEISDLGALVHTGSRLLPGTHVDVHLMTVGGRVLRRARVVRAHVWQLEVEGILYRVGLAFDAPVDTSPRWVGATHDGVTEASAIGTELPTSPEPDCAAWPNRRQNDSAGGGEVAPGLEMGPGRTLAKESRDGVQQ